MAKKQALKMEFKCENCGKSQPKNNEKSNENWNVYDRNQKCECGGKFIAYVNGQRLN